MHKQLPKDEYDSRVGWSLQFFLEKTQWKERCSGEDRSLHSAKDKYRIILGKIRVRHLQHVKSCLENQSFPSGNSNSYVKSRLESFLYVLCWFSNAVKLLSMVTS